MRNIKKAIVHCDASSNDLQGSISAVKELHTSPKEKAITWGIYKTHGKGWSDVGYHYYIQSDGTLEYGRPIEKVGAHCAGLNTESIGICLHGGKLSDFTQSQYKTLRKLLESIVMIYPNITIHGHNEFADKTCPIIDMKPFKSIQL